MLTGAREIGLDFFSTTIQQPLQQKGIRFINPSWNWFRGAKRVLVSKTPIFSPQEIKGLKVRIFDSEGNSKNPDRLNGWIGEFFFSAG